MLMLLMLLMPMLLNVMLLMLMLMLLRLMLMLMLLMLMLMLLLLMTRLHLVQNPLQRALPALLYATKFCHKVLLEAQAATLRRMLRNPASFTSILVR